MRIYKVKIVGVNYMVEGKKSLIVGSILAFIAASILFYIGTWSLGQCILYSVVTPEYVPLYLFLTIIAFLGFVAGIIGGIFALKKKKSVAIAGVGGVIAVSIITIVMSVFPIYHTILLIAIPALVLSALGIFFVELPLSRTQPRRLKPAPIEVKMKPPKSVPKLKAEKIEEAVFKYIQDRRGAIDKEECLADLGITEKQFNATIRSLEKSGELRLKKRG